MSSAAAVTTRDPQVRAAVRCSAKRGLEESGFTSVPRWRMTGDSLDAIPTGEGQSDWSGWLTRRLAHESSTTELPLIRRKSPSRARSSANHREECG
jgi:hypothetical protein